MPRYPVQLARFLPLAALVLGCLVLGGCAGPAMLKENSPLRSATMWPDTVVLEVFFVRVPLGDVDANETLWQHVDEQRLPAELREHLAHNGFRVGLVGNRVPDVLQRLLQLEDKPAPSGGASKIDAESMADKPTVVRRHLSIRKGHRKEIVTSGIHDSLPLLIHESGQLSGKTYHKAQGVLAVKTFPESGGRVRIDLTPELHHDAIQQRWVGDRGMLRLEAKRPRRIFDKMALSTSMSPGDMLVVGCLPDRLGSLGYHFLAEEDGRMEQKLIIFRLSQTQHDDLFGPADILSLE